VQLFPTRGNLFAWMNEWRFKLLYDGECPFCVREVRWLQRRNRHGRLAFEDITSPDFDPARYDATREELMGVIHGVFPDGRVVCKLEVFRQAYRAVGLGWLIAPTDWLVLRWIFDRLYLLFARNRVSIGRVFGRSCKVGTCDAREQDH
jgi:predicted DCC family thiol-disulfide oxidoreductase YuxK